MPDTVVGLFRNRPEAEAALGKLKEAGFGSDQVSMSTPAVRRRGRYGLKVAVGIAVGTLLGALAGAIAKLLARRRRQSTPIASRHVPSANSSVANTSPAI